MTMNNITFLIANVWPDFLRENYHKPKKSPKSTKNYPKYPPLEWSYRLQGKDSQATSHFDIVCSFYILVDGLSTNSWFMK